MQPDHVRQPVAFARRFRRQIIYLTALTVAAAAALAQGKPSGFVWLGVLVVCLGVEWLRSRIAARELQPAWNRMFADDVREDGNHAA